MLTLENVLERAGWARFRTEFDHESRASERVDRQGRWDLTNVPLLELTDIHRCRGHHHNQWWVLHRLGFRGGGPFELGVSGHRRGIDRITGGPG